MCYPRNHEIWIKAPSPRGFGLSILPDGKQIRGLKNVSHIIVFKEGKSIPGDLILYRTALDHFSLEPGLPMELEGMHQDTQCAH